MTNVNAETVWVDAETFAKPDYNSFIKYLVENKYSNITEQYEIYNQKQYILTKNQRNEWYCTYIREKNYLTQIIYDVIQNYSLQLRDIEKILLKFSIIINFVPETHALCLPFLIDLIILNTYYPHIYNYINGKTPADNYNSSEKLQKLRSETFSIIKVMNYEKYSENNIYHCRNDLKNYFNLIDFAQDFNI